MDVRLKFPAALALDETKLILETDTSTGSKPPPKLVRETGFQFKKTSDSFDLHLGTGIGPTQYLYLRALYDVNGNGKKDSGDYEGTLVPAPFEAHDRGCLKGNDNRAPDVMMTLVP